MQFTGMCSAIPTTMSKFLCWFCHTSDRFPCCTAPRVYYYCVLLFTMCSLRVCCPPHLLLSCTSCVPPHHAFSSWLLQALRGDAVYPPNPPHTTHNPPPPPTPIIQITYGVEWHCFISKGLLLKAVQMVFDLRCNVYHVLCFLFCISCSVYPLLCILYCVSCSTSLQTIWICTM